MGSTKDTHLKMSTNNGFTDASLKRNMNINQTIAIYFLTILQHTSIFASTISDIKKIVC